MLSSATPRSPSLRLSFSCTAGRRTAQLANPKPLRKKIPSTATRAAHVERSVIDSCLTTSLLPCSRAKDRTPREGSRRGLRGAGIPPCGSPLPFAAHQEQRCESPGHSDARADAEGSSEPLDQRGGACLPATRQGPGAGRGDRRERGQAQSCADLRAGAEDAGGESPLLLLYHRGPAGRRGDRRAAKGQTGEGGVGEHVGQSPLRRYTEEERCRGTDA